MFENQLKLFKIDINSNLLNKYVISVHIQLLLNKNAY